MEQKYKFIDKTGTCFRDFGLKYSDDSMKQYRGLVASWLVNHKTFGVGDMLCFRDELTEAGFEWGVDFYVIKVSPY